MYVKVLLLLSKRKRIEMNEMNAIFLVVSIFTTVQGATIQVPCKNDTDCMPGQCCYLEPEFLVASRRRESAVQLDLAVKPVKHDTGVCENYHLVGERCYYLEKVNGHCGCAPGLTCQWDPSCIRPTDDGTNNKHHRGAPCPWVQGSEKCMRTS